MTCTHSTLSSQWSVPVHNMCVYILLLLLGESYTSLQCLYRITRQTFGKIVPETCSVICEVLKDYMKVRK